MRKIEIPSWHECNELVDNFERTDRTIYSAVMHGAELTPLEKMVYDYDDADPDRSRQYIQDLKALVEWCINNPVQVLAQHEQED